MVMMKIVFIAFGLLFTVIGIGVIIGSVVYKNALKNSREVSGTIVDFIKRRGRGQGGHMHTYCYPVYEYYDDGEFKRHESNVSVMPPKPLGTEVTLYISEDGKIKETQGTSFLILFGSIFAFVGIIFTIVSLMMY